MQESFSVPIFQGLLCKKKSEILHKADIQVPAWWLFLFVSPEVLQLYCNTKKAQVLPLNVSPSLFDVWILEDKNLVNHPGGGVSFLL